MKKKNNLTYALNVRKKINSKMNKKKRICKYCGSEISTEIGLKNWKNLFRKPTLDDWIMLFIIFMAIFSYYQYQIDINNIIEYYENGDYCYNQYRLLNQKIQSNQNPLEKINLDEFDNLVIPDNGGE